MIEPVIQHFNTEAPDYHTRSMRWPWSLLRQREAQAVVQALRFGGRSPAGASCLDAGCGAGYYSAILRDLGASLIHGVDASPAMLEAYRHAGFEGWPAELSTLQLPQRYDVVLCAGALEFCRQPEVAAQQLAAHVAPGGMLVLLMPRACTAGRLYQWSHARHGVHIHLFSDDPVNWLPQTFPLRRPKGFQPMTRGFALIDRFDCP
jgi:2-polyprenyl-3-methyl-5-hydroxy-6-metoxy-1,4-benzoquinol methylase